jgi:hypothetical protein
VTPDELLLPTREDLAAGRDPALSRAATLAGASLDPKAAGALFTHLRSVSDEDEKSDDDEGDKGDDGGKDKKEKQGDKDKKKGDE